MLNRLRKTRPERSIRTRLLVTTALVGAIAATALLPAASAKTGGAAAEARMAGSGVPKLPGYELTWKDDFNGAAGKPVEPGKWIYDTGTGYGCAGCPSNWGTFEIESMTDSPQNVSFDGQGNLLITPLKQADGTWTSGRIETRKTDSASGAPGILRVQGSIQLPQTGVGPAAAGYWPAFWMLGDGFRGNYLNWPGVGEIDIMENINGRPTAFSTLHCGVAPGGPCNEFSGIGKTTDNATLQDSFHTYAMELDKSVQPNELRFFLDVAVGGSFPWAECNFFPHAGGCSGSTPFPEVVTPATVSGKPMKVAYVAVYNKK